ncbi:ornithine cyclodeaminase family protein [Algoriphagus halophytocola]|uniref:Ornithine cyclodeaminase family protein n=1 Tax=Algoriphagus halophytocola TaxID=2991499 RepID=A0ABY6MJ22_9BACT|nr:MULTISPECIES: ornithine cyclodeaminase family protein [unclassified Algoriphagus]UZD23479.1 ornithine cyclodeaminase family protein [Algoriphagus sp. TR-M5]WBL44773.1 ornithine cyclodeaminase family protein [Algoriphagus sp. TR-M9]
MFKSRETIIIDSDAIIQIIKTIGLHQVMEDLIFELRESLVNFSEKEIEVPARSGFNYKKPFLGLVEWMPVMKKGHEVIIKVVGYHPDNPKLFKIPTILSTISSYDSHTGHLNFIVDGVLLTALRTGASSALASQLMAHPDSTSLGIIGCGAQSVTQIHALSRLFDLKEIRIFDTDPSAMKSLQARIAPLDLPINLEFSDIDEIIATSDIVCTATSIAPEKGPLFEHYECKPHLHINAVGADFPGKIELPLSFLRKAKVCPDFLEQAVVEGECQQLAPEEIGPSWVKLMQSKESHTAYQKCLSVFDSTGWALEDLVVANLFADYAEKLGLGEKVNLESYSADEKNPYGMLYSSAKSLQK